MIRQYISYVPQKVRSYCDLNACCIYYGVLSSHTKSLRRNYGKSKDEAPPFTPEPTALLKDRDCKQFITIGKILNSFSSRTHAGDNKISIIGLDDVGIATVFTLLTKDVTDNICMIDFNEEVLRGEQMDLHYSSLFLNNPKILASKDPALTRDSKICVVTTGTFKGRDEDEPEYIARNAAIIRSIIPTLVKFSPNTIFIVASDPVDILSFVTWKLSGLPKHRIIGIGTMLDTARFRYLLSEKMGISPQSCQGYIIGQHGPNSVPVWSSVNIGGVRLHDINPQAGNENDPENWHELHRDVVRSDDLVRYLKGSVSWAVALGVTEICRAILKNANIATPVSTLAKGEHNIREDVFLSLPCVIGRSGVTDLIRQSLNDTETTLLRRCAENVAQMQESASKIYT